MDDALFQRYQKLVVKPTQRRRTGLRGVLVTLLFVVPFLLGALHFAGRAGAPSWIVPVGILIGVVSMPLANYTRFRPDRSRWRTALYYMAFVLTSDGLARWLTPAHPDGFLLQLTIIFSISVGFITISAIQIFESYRTKPDPIHPT